MAGMSLATTAFAKAAIGSTEIETISLGATEIWSATPPAPVTFHTISSVTNGGGTLNLSLTTTEVTTVLVPLSRRSTGTVSSVTLNGNAMSTLVSRGFNDGTLGSVRVFALEDVPSGSISISISFSSTDQGRAYALAYENVGSIGTPTTQFGSGTVASNSVSAPVEGGLTMQMFGFYQSGTLTPTGGTTRGSSNGLNTALSVSDTDSATSFSTTISLSSSWAGATIPLLPAS
ncbi:hypothetical protein FH32_gp06 [Mycobacterium phage Lamina13]|uniref:hypothetical protein n=1 Tax=Mycobacterium phage Lamina13 TaxID=1468169 RepID=UPI00043B0C14|nr:hypothetical protein FH32_gp06 [Mycobacterium phage Lamina13]AHN84420.1 hypothetical protein PBI_LAMINA13_6 [Mycobacterium phage Lamina13]